MFDPQWPSTSATGADDDPTNGSSDAGSSETAERIGSGADMNGDAHDMKPDGAPAPAEARPNSDSGEGSPEGAEGVEVTHDPLTGSISVSTDAAENDASNDDEADRQCQLWPSADDNTTNNDHNNDDHSSGALDGGGEVELPNPFGDIWSTAAFALDAASPLKDLLDAHSFSLVDLLAQDELLQELRGGEARLVDFFSTPDAVAGLVECLMVEVPDDGSKEGRERWCTEEEGRRRRQREVREKQHHQMKIMEDNHDDEAALQSPKMTLSTVLDASSPRQNDPTVEARWNSPKKPPPGEWLFGSSPDNDDDPQPQGEELNERTPAEEYDLRFVRYPYMACEVLCSEVGPTLDVLVDGYVDDVAVNEINDEEDSLLGDNVRGELKEVKMVDSEGESDAPMDEMDDSNGGGTHHPTMPRAMPPGPPPSLSPQMSPPKLPPIPTPPGTPASTPVATPASTPVATPHPATPVPTDKPPPRRRILDLLFAPLIDLPPATLDDRRAGYLEKVLNALFRRRGEAMGDYMNTSLLVTTNSTDMTRDILGNAAAFVRALCSGQPSEYTSLPGTHSPPMERRDSGIGRFPSPHAPPMLLCALCDHLHSHSIMHVVQRLLLPSPSREGHRKAAEAEGTSSEGKEGTGEGNGRDDGDAPASPTSDMNDRFMHALNQMNGGPPPPLADDDDEDEEMDEDDPANNIFQCDWSERPRYALELLLRRLEGDTGSFLAGYGFPVGYDVDASQRTNRAAADGENKAQEEEAEAALAGAQHASEVLVSIVQHSALDSPVMRTVASDPALQRIVDLILAETQPEFVAHESLMTCAMTVLESVVLQLGGYGAVAAPDGTEGDAPAAKESMASAASLIRHAPALLARLSYLLHHPVTATWTAPSQHAPSRPLLGTSRLRILRLLEALVLLGDPGVDAALRESDALAGALDLFWTFEWCSMLHQSAANLLVHVFEGGEGRAGLQEYFLGRCNLLGRLMDSFDDEVVAAPSAKEANGAAGGGTEEMPAGNIGREMMVAMKNLYSERATSSMESEDGSESSDPNDPVPVSEDDVDSAMEKESQDGGDALIAMTSEESNDDSDDVAPSERPGDLIDENSTPALQQEKGPSDDQSRTTFRKGYMGHVIIICQALVHACNNSGDIKQDEPGNDGTATDILDEPECLLSSPPSLDEVSDATNFETFAVQSPVAPHEDIDAASANGSKKRKDRSPVRDRTGDDVKRPATSPVPSDDDGPSFSSPISPISGVPSSPTVNVDTEASLSSPIDTDAADVLSIGKILQRHPQYDKWKEFVASSLASEMSLQSTPLGGPGPQNPAASDIEGGHAMPSTIEDNCDSDFLGSANSAIGGMAIMDGIDMDENDLDIAASMMEALSLPPAANGDASSQPVGHSRRRGVSLLGGGETASSEESSGIGNFGSVIQQPGGFKGYVYDDPLGGLNPFDGDDQEGTNVGDGGGSNEDDGFMSDAVCVTRQGSEGVEKEESQGNDVTSDGDDEEDDDDVPVMDLFAGTFADFDAFESSAPSDKDNPFGSDPFEGGGDNGSGDDNFTPIGSESDKAADDAFGFSKTPFDLVDSLSGDEVDQGTAAS